MSRRAPGHAGHRTDDGHLITDQVPFIISHPTAGCASWGKSPPISEKTPMPPPPSSMTLTDYDPDHNTAAESKGQSCPNAELQRMHTRAHAMGQVGP